MRKICTRVITGLLSLSMIFSLVVPAYADYNGSGSGSGSLDGSGSWWVNKQGVRVSIVDKNGNTVLSGTSGGKNYTSIDILFSNLGNNAYSMSGNKFQGKDDGDNLAISVGALNALINRAIDANKYLSELKKLPTYSENYPDSYSGLPLPILYEGSKYVGNGEAVKEFFIKGSLGSFTISSVTYNPSLPSINTGSGSSGSSSSGGGYNNGSVSSGAKIKTVYGYVTRSWLNNHISQVNGMTISQLKNSPYVKTSSVNSMISNFINRVYSSYLTSKSNIYSIANLNALANQYSYSTTGVYNGWISYEQCRLTNALIQSTVTAIRNMLATASRYKIPKYSVAAAIRNCAVYTYTSGIPSINRFPSIMSLYENDIMIPLISGEAIPEDTKSILYELVGTDDIEKSDIDAIVESGESNVALIEQLYKISQNYANGASSAVQAKEDTNKVLKAAFGENYQTMVESLGGIDSLCSKILTGGSGALILGKEVIEACKSANTEVDFDVDLDYSSSSALEDALNNSQFINGEEGSTEKVIYTSEHVKKLLQEIVADASKKGINGITYNSLLALLAGSTEAEKLSKAAVDLNIIGVDAWVKSLDLSNFVSVGFDTASLYDNEGYIWALLDIKDGNGKYYFNIDLGDQESAYLEMLKSSNDNVDSPSKRFAYGGYGLVLEPITWIRPGSWNGSPVYYTNYIYGTPSNIADWLVANNKNEGAHHDLLKIFGSCMYINEDIGYFKNKVSGLGSGAKVTNVSDFKNKLAVNIGDSNFGYGWHFAAMDTVNLQHSTQVTWNSSVPSPGRAPDPSDLPDPSKTNTGTDTGNPGKEFTIIKYYETWDYSSGEVKVVERQGPTIRQKNPNIISIVDEPQYEVQDWYTTSNTKLPKENDTSEIYQEHYDSDKKIQVATVNSLNQTVTLDPDTGEKVLVVLLVKKINEPNKTPTELEITESEINKVVHTDSNINGTNWGNYEFKINLPDLTSHLKSGSSYKAQFEFSGMHTINFGSSLEIGDGKHNLLSPQVYSSDGKIQVALTNLGKQTITISSDGNKADGADYVSLIWRYYDIPTLAAYKKDDIVNKLGSDNWNIPASILGNSNISQRKRAANGDVNKTLTIKFGTSQNTGKLIENGKEKANITASASTWSYTFSANVKIHTYRGDSSLKGLGDMPFTNKDNTVMTQSTGANSAVTVIQGEQKVSFYPYIKMTYQINSLQAIKLEEETGTPTKFNTYVLSENMSSILPSDAVEVGWVNANEKNSMNIVSQQWSLHASAVKGNDGWQGANQVLPGGAIYQLNTDGNKTSVKLTTYQTIVGNDTRGYLAQNLTGNEYTVDNAVNSHNSFIDDAKEILDNLCVVQWVSKDFKSTYAWPSNWNKSSTENKVCVTGGGQSLSKLGLSIKTSSESKYYLTGPGTSNPASEADLDILSETQVNTLFKVFTDTEGNVYVATAKGDNINNLINQLEKVNADNLGAGVTKVLDKSVKWEDVNSKLTGDIKNVDARTSIVTNVVKALERNTGDDKTASWATSDGNWYNEAFDGIYVLRQATSLNVGFKDTSVRAAALDPALCPPNSGQSDLYSTAFLSQFCMDTKSSASIASGKPDGYIGTFKGQNIILPNMAGLYQTRKFYIPNATVQDLG